MNLNPLGLNGPNHPGNVQQPNTANPTVHPNVASYAVGTNVLNLSWPIPAHQELDVKTHPSPPFPLS